MGFFSLNKKPKTCEERKAATEKTLKKLGIPFINHLPYIDDFKTAQFRTSAEVAKRILVLSCIIDAIHTEGGINKTAAIESLKAHELWEDATPKEKHFLLNDVEEAFIFEFSWKIEAVYVLFWAIGFVSLLKLPKEPASIDNLHQKAHAKFGSIKNFITEVKLRDTEDILNETDFIYRLNWAVTDAILKETPIPNNYHPGIVYQRHYALNWLTYYHENWDDITTDT